MSSVNQQQRVFLALADPTRRMLIEKLSAEGDKTSTELARDLPITRQGVSKHLGVLAEAKLVSVRQEGRDRYYTLLPQPLTEAATWVDRVRTQWERRLSALVDYLDQVPDER